jgi:cytochrome b561
MSLILRSEAPPSEPSEDDDQGRVYVIRQYELPAQVMHWVTAGLVFCMFASGVIAKHLEGGDFAVLLMGLHKLTGVCIFTLIVTRVIYRLTRSTPEWRLHAHRRPVLHWTLYGVAALVPFLGWAGISDFGAREVLPGIWVPKIWPEGAGYDEWLLLFHAYCAFLLLGLVALHIGIALQDYMTDRRIDETDAPADDAASRSAGLGRAGSRGSVADL